VGTAACNGTAGEQVSDSSLRTAVMQVTKIHLAHFASRFSKWDLHEIVRQLSICYLRAVVQRICKPHLHASIRQLARSDLLAAIEQSPISSSTTENDHHYQSELDDVIGLWRKSARSTSFPPDCSRIALAVKNGNVHL